MIKIVPHTTSGKTTNTKQSPNAVYVCLLTITCPLLQAEQTTLGLLSIRQPGSYQRAGQVR